MKHLFIVNPKAGDKKDGGEALVSEIKRFAAELDDPYEVYITTGPMDACEKVAAEADKCDKLHVYACGGDGTLNECANGAAGRANTAITQYPCGTGNDFIRMFGEADMHKFSDLRKLVNGTVRPVDLIDCNGRYGMNICSVGIDARIGTDVHKYSKIPVIGGATGYIVSLIVNLLKGINSEFTVSTSENTYSGEFSLICACNGRFYGGGFNPVPEAMPDDGQIEFLIVKGVSRLKLVRIINKYAKGRYRELEDVITHYRGETMQISGGSEFVVNIDGEAIYASRVSLKLVPAGINFIFPMEMEFFETRSEKTEE